ncbi:MAG: LacI family DNA-binding transcriptional regulator [Candidatus Synoicihabitans palmerolidicus]|nr:LacI family DNA-binding transcriptional regulator [Candidatus Synoicihabitans palmerolidicus]
MRDVAAHSGLSRSTVSLVLRNSPSIPEATRQRVMASVEALGYRPNPLVSALMSFRNQRQLQDRHTVLAYLTTHPPPASSWKKVEVYAAMFRGAQARAGELGFRLEEFWLRSQGMSSRRMAEVLRSRGILGVIVNPLPEGERTLDFNLQKFAAVGLGVRVLSPVIEQVATDNFQAGAEAIRRCRQLGYQRIGFVMSHEGSERLEHRYLAAVTLDQRNLPTKQQVKPLLPQRLVDILGQIPG